MSSRGAPATVDWLRARLEDAQLPAGITRASLLVNLGEYLGMAGQTEAAGEAFRAAVADVGAAHPDARCYLAGWCLRSGNADEGRRLFAEIWAGRPSDWSVYLHVGETFEEADDAREAIRWFTAGAMRAERAGDLINAQMLMAARGRVRRAEGFAEDEYDRRGNDLYDVLYAERS